MQQLLPFQLPDEADTDQLLRWLDINRQPLFGLYKLGEGQEVRPLEETPPEIKPQGTVETVPQTGARIYAGYDSLVPGQYSVTVGIWATDRISQRLLRTQVMEAAMRCRFAVSGNLTLPITRFSSISPAWRGSSALGSTVKVVFEPASAYWLQGWKSQVIPVGISTTVINAGDMATPLKISITAGSSDVLNPLIETDVGPTTWLGTIPAGQTLVIDATPGLWSVTLNGDDARLQLRGPQPALLPGTRSVTITASGASAAISWQEGVL